MLPSCWQTREQINLGGSLEKFALAMLEAAPSASLEIIYMYGRLADVSQSQPCEVRRVMLQPSQPSAR